MFTQPCFIRKNTKEIIEKLEELEYDYAENGAGAWFIPLCQLEYIGVNIYSKGYYMGVNGVWSNDWCDCGTDDRLFIALAALRDDSDYMQYFTNGTDFIICDREDWIDMYSVLCSGAYTTTELDKFHKATPQELIEYFKDR